MPARLAMLGKRRGNLRRGNDRARFFARLCAGKQRKPKLSEVCVSVAQLFGVQYNGQGHNSAHALVSVTQIFGIQCDSVCRFICRCRVSVTQLFGVQCNVLAGLPDRQVSVARLFGIQCNGALSWTGWICFSHTTFWDTIQLAEITSPSVTSFSRTIFWVQCNGMSSRQIWSGVSVARLFGVQCYNDSEGSLYTAVSVAQLLGTMQHVH